MTTEPELVLVMTEPKSAINMIERIADEIATSQMVAGRYGGCGARLARLCHFGGESIARAGLPNHERQAGVAGHGMRAECWWPFGDRLDRCRAAEQFRH